jgi:hypothetical protein
MHGSLMKFISACPSADFKDKRIIEVGSYNVNGSPRELIMSCKPACYVGVDRRPGPGVDIVVDASIPVKTIEEADKFDVVICLNTLEHCDKWQGLFCNLKYLTRTSGGLIIFSVPAPGFRYHDEPDYWRFDFQQVQIMFSDMRAERIEKDPDIPGTIVKAWSTQKMGTQSLEGIVPHPAWVAEKPIGGGWDDV